MPRLRTAGRSTLLVDFLIAQKVIIGLVAGLVVMSVSRRGLTYNLFGTFFWDGKKSSETSCLIIVLYTMCPKRNVRRCLCVCCCCCCCCKYWCRHYPHRRSPLFLFLPSYAPPLLSYSNRLCQRKPRSTAGDTRQRATHTWRSSIPARA